MFGKTVVMVLGVAACLWSSGPVRQLDVRVLEELGAAPACAVVEEAHEGVFA
jgi:hypothetical protein